ncbi:MAG: dihydrodipicolinate synthase family protein, partial [Pseudomonadota bacterium]|nr:dihydrodipicolinate synthase family protein [Pseudomonadota bacterium]
MSGSIRGSIVALVTPMRADGSLDLAAFDRLIDWHVESGTHAVVVAGTTGESATLSVQEHCDLVAHCVKVTGNR